MAQKKRAKRRAAPSVPLTHRLPNPPAVWVGRDADIAWLEAAIERAPVTLVSGPGGVGKTALVQKTLHDRFARRVDRAIFVDVPTGQPAAQVRQDILRALAVASDEDELDWPTLQADAMTAIAAILDLAEAGSFIVVIDDVHQSEVDEIDELLTALASYAKKSRFVATSRLTPRLSTLAGQILTLSAMSDGDLGELASRWAPHVEATLVRRALAAASGSPWLLSQLLVTGSTERDLEQGGLLAGVSESAAELLRSLAIIDVPLPLDVITLFAPHPGEAELLALERRGLVTRSSGGIRLHDVARGLLSRRGGIDDARLAQAAAVLGHEELVDAKLEAIRLFAKLGRMDAVAELLHRHAESLLAQGYTPRLFKILKDHADPAIDAWKLRCAAELGNPTALAQVRAPTRREGSEVLAWARTLRASGDAEDAAAQLEKLLADEGALELKVAVEARLLLAACLRHLGRIEESLALLREIRSTDEEVALAVDAARALSLTLMGAAPLDELVSVRARVVASDNPQASQAALDAATAFAEIGMMPEAAELAARSRPEAARPDLLVHRESLLLSASIAGGRGALDEARKLADSVRAFARGSSILLPLLHEIDIARRLSAGELDGLEPFSDACTKEAAGIDARTDAALASLRVRLATLQGRQDRHVLELGPEASALRTGQEARLFEALRRARVFGALEREEHATPAAFPNDRRLAIIARLTQATLAIASGDAAAATHQANDAVRVAARHELRILEVESRFVLAEALVMAGRRSDLSAETSELTLLARSMRSPRYERETELFALVAKGTRIPPAFLQRLAASENVAPVGARRARALLGGEPPLDHVDLRVLEALAGSGAHDTYELLGRAKAATPTATGAAAAADESDATWARGWGVDARSSAVWLGDGRSFDFAQKAQAFRILEVLAEHGGAASKEVLVTEAWGEAEYHPLRHDGKLHVAVRKLRELIEDDPATPVRLATTEDGYRLGGIVRWIRRA